MMEISPDCVLCTIKKIDNLYDQLSEISSDKLHFMKKIYHLAAEAEQNDTAPHLSAKMMRVLLKDMNLEDPYKKQKVAYNKLLLTKEFGIESFIRESKKPVIAALKYAMVGNLIDFGAMDDVPEEELEKLLASAINIELDNEILDEFFLQLESANKLVYIGDNAGEIVLDKIFVKILTEKFPNLKIAFIVRGKPIFNDATMEDAAQIGLNELVTVYANGSDIPGTQLDYISKDALSLIEDADLVLAKGQGNFETLVGCGKNIFYLFLCKCDLFTKRFNMNKFDGVFTHESRL